MQEPINSEESRTRGSKKKRTKHWQKMPDWRTSSLEGGNSTSAVAMSNGKLSEPTSFDLEEGARQPFPTREPATPNLSSALILYSKSSPKTPRNSTQPDAIASIVAKYTPRCAPLPPPRGSRTGSSKRRARRNTNQRSREMEYARQRNADRVPKAAQDVFDSLEWDPELPNGAEPSPDKSPEQVPFKAQPLTYTTVGSLVNPATAPKFTAPHRIQREGAQRRPFLSILQSRGLGLDSGPPPPLNLSNSMQYAQQITRSPTRVDAVSVPSTSSSSSRSATGHSSQMQPPVFDGFGNNQQYAPILTQDEKDVLARQTSGHTLSSAAIYTKAPDVIVTTKEIGERHVPSRTGSSQSSIQGLEKMQTLQRLSKFDNPLQEFARTRLSEFAVSNQLGKTIANPAGAPSRQVASYTQRASLSQQTSGELNRSYQFPPQGPPGFNSSTSNPLVSSYGIGDDQINAGLSRPGYPQPLTAGPPGQRQSNASMHQSAAHSQALMQTLYGDQRHESTGDQYGLTGFEAQLSGQITRASMYRQPPAATHRIQTPDVPYPNRNIGHATTRVVETLGLLDAQKYYPHGYPKDFLDNEGATIDPPKTKEQKRKELDEWFYGGQVRFMTMKAKDYVQENSDKKKDFGPIGPPKKHTKIELEDTLTVEGVQALSLADCTAPFLDAAFGSMMSYYDRDTPGSKANLSGFVDNKAENIDPTSMGNTTMFGEDWGAPAKSNSHRYR